ncbi:MAG: helix-turn-helix domain-containing protein [Desulfarculus sp.]|nr:helix-turn-helix domain-containing protein [Desulfarculus sp.]
MNDVEVQSRVIAMSAAGCSNREVARETGVSPQTVGRWVNKPDIKAEIERVHRELLKGSLDTARANIEYVVDKFKQYEQEGNKEFAGLSLKYSAEVLRSVGCLPAHAPAVAVQNILSADRGELSPAVQEVLSQLGRRLAGADDAIDVGAEPLRDEGEG